MIYRISPRYHEDIFSKTMVTLDLHVGKIGPEIGKKSIFPTIFEKKWYFGNIKLWKDRNDLANCSKISLRHLWQDHGNFEPSYGKNWTRHCPKIHFFLQLFEKPMIIWDHKRMIEMIYGICPRYHETFKARPW